MKHEKAVQQLNERLERIAQKYDKFDNQKKAALYRSYKGKTDHIPTKDLILMVNVGKRYLDELLDKYIK